MAGCRDCGGTPSVPVIGVILGSDGKPMPVEAETLIDAAKEANKQRNPEFQQSMFVTGKRYDVALNYDVAIYYASMCSDMLLFPLRYKIEKCDCAKEKTLVNILTKNRDIIDDVLKELR